MKKVITKLGSISLILMLLISTLLISVATPASGDTLRWSLQGTPLGIGITYQLAVGSDAAFIKVASNGDVFVVDTQAASGTLNRVMKSTTGGRTWAPSAPLALTATMNVVDIAVSPSYATDLTVVALGAEAAAAPAISQVFISTNGGASFAVLGGTIPGLAKSIAIAPNYNAGGEIMVGTTDANNVAGTYGDVYFWGRAGVQNWTATALAEDVTKVAYSPNFAIDATRLAIGSITPAGANTGTRLHTLVSNDATWDLTLAVVPVIDLLAGDTGDAAAVASSVLAMPSDFNASLLFNRTAYVGINSALATDNLYRVVVNSAGVAVALNPLTIFGIADMAMSSLAYVGTGASGTLFSGYSAAMFVMRTTGAGTSTAAVPPSWIPSTAGPTGAANVYIALAADFATSNKIYAGSTGAESGVSVSNDGGAFFSHAGLIDTAALVMNDFQVANANEFFMVTSGGVTISVWKTADAGATWYRQLALASALTGIARISPNYATDQTAWVGVVGAAVLQVTGNGGASWTARTSPVVIGDLAVKDQYTAYVSFNAAGGTVQSTANGGWTWQPVATVTAAAQVITDLKYDVATGHLMVGLNNGFVMLSTNSNVSYIPLGAGIGGTNTIVAFDAAYATNNFVYAGSAVGGTADIKRFQVGTYTAWLACGSAVPIAGVRDILVAPDGSLYVSDITPAAGFSRSLNPSAGFPTLSLAVWDNAVGAGLPAAATMTVLSRAEGSNIVYGIEAVSATIYTYTDTLSAATPTPIAPAGGTVIDAQANAVFLVFDAVPGALTYRVRYDTRTDFQTATTTVAATDPAAPTTRFRIGAGVLVGGFNYNWQVRVQTPVVGPYCDAATFTTQLAALALNAPGVAVGPQEGGTAPGGWNAALTPTFQWTAIANATSYEFQLATDVGMTDLIIDATGANALGNQTSYHLTSPALANNTTYYWRVKAISATTNTDWSTVAAFTTLAAAPAPTPPVQVTTTPAPVIEVVTPAPPPDFVLPAPAVADEIAPGYIWAIIVIGAILVIAVIVLIVRTRRSV